MLFYALLSCQGEDMNAQMLRMLSGMNLGGDDAGTDGMESGFMPMMQGMMESLLSKEVLYPSLKEITSKVSILSQLPLSLLH